MFYLHVDVNAHSKKNHKYLYAGVLVGLHVNANVHVHVFAHVPAKIEKYIYM